MKILAVSRRQAITPKSKKEKESLVEISNKERSGKDHTLHFLLFFYCWYLSVISHHTFGCFFDLDGDGEEEEQPGARSETPRVRESFGDPCSC